MNIDDTIQMDRNGLELLGKGLFAQTLHVVADLVELGHCQSQLPFCQVLTRAEGVEAQQLGFHGLEGTVVVS